MNSLRKNLIGLSRADLANELAKLDAKPFRVKQLWHWIYHQGATDFNKMTSISKKFREELIQYYDVKRPKISCKETSSDLTQKWLIQFSDGNEAETVYIPEQDRGAVCISSQVGCTLNCTFCHTGTQKLVRNLTPDEIIGQFMIVRDAYNEWPSPKDGGRKISNIVIMGMGEPLFNYGNVATALKIIMDPEGLSLSKRRITLSTSGVVPLIKQCGNDLGVNLAISLHAVTNELRDILVPINRKYPLAELVKACKAYPGANNARRITFEYVMLKGINDSEADAKELIRLVKGIPAKFNLIPFNAWPGAPYTCSTTNTIQTFSRILNEGGYSSPIRQPRGRDILAACGQLKSMSTRKDYRKKSSPLLTNV